MKKRSLSQNVRVEHKNNKICLITELSLNSYHSILKKTTINMLECMCLLLGVEPFDVVFHDKYKNFKTKKATIIKETIIKAVKSKKLIVESRFLSNAYYTIDSIPLYFTDFDTRGFVNGYRFFIKDFLREITSDSIKIKTSDFLKWALVQTTFPLPLRLQKELKFFAIKPEKLHIAEQNKLINQVIAQVLWFLNPWKSKKNIEKDLKNDKVLSSYGSAQDYIGINTFSRWLKDIDSRNSKDKQPKISGKIKNNCSYRIKLIPRVFLLQKQHTYVNYLKLKLILQNLTKTLNYKNRLTANQIKEHPLIKAYIKNLPKIPYQFALDWIQEVFY